MIIDKILPLKLDLYFYDENIVSASFMYKTCYHDAIYGC